MAGRYTRCTCCGAAFYSSKDQEPEFDKGFGRCEACKPILVADMVKYGWAGKMWTVETATERVNLYA